MILRILFLVTLVGWTFGEESSEEDNNYTPSEGLTSYESVPNNNIRIEVSPSIKWVNQGEDAEVLCTVIGGSHTFNCIQWKDITDSHSFASSNCCWISTSTCKLTLLNVIKDSTWVCIAETKPQDKPIKSQSVSINVRSSSPKLDLDIWAVIILIISLFVVLTLIMLGSVLVYRRFWKRQNARRANANSTRDLINDNNLVELGAGNLNAAIPYDVSDKPPSYEESMRHNSQIQTPSAPPPSVLPQ